jgi:hypothetical protein
MRRFKLPLIMVLLVGLVSIAYSQDIITSEDAAKFIGQQKTVCGTVGNTHFAPKREGQPTFIDFEKPYPNQVFTALIWGPDRGKFKTPPEILYSGKEICVTGMIESYEDRPAIVVKNPGQVTLK